MGRLRYIEPELWQNAELRRLGLVARNVFLYLFSAHADDEGRFRWDAYAILDGAFGRADPVTEEQVETALQGLAESGMIARYGSANEYGFLTGWFSHQSMHKNVRRNSAMPRPPVKVGSWAEADAVRDAYGQATKTVGSRCSYRESLRWFADEQRSGSAEPTETLRRSAETFPEEGEGEVEGVTTSCSSSDEQVEPVSDAPLVLVPNDPEKPPRKESEKQRLIRLAFEKLTNEAPPNGDEARAFWKSVNKILSVNGIPDLKAWVHWRLTNNLLMPEGCIAKDWFPAEYRKAMTWGGRKEWGVKR